MLKYIVLGTAVMCLFNIAAHAAGEGTATPREPAGIALGAILGGLLGGPPGAILGAAGGGWLGARDGAKDGRIAELERRLAGREAEFALLQDRFNDLDSGRDAASTTVALEQRRRALDQLAAGVSLTIHFRTGSAEIDPAQAAPLGDLARFLADFPGIRLQLDAHADRRGGADYNRDLSTRRANAVRERLLSAGLEPGRLEVHAWGESRASAVARDAEGLMFDRRVTVQLSLDTEA
jgi:outer membrane protein OmpA-like peptidoglycan-associated protein